MAFYYTLTRYAVRGATAAELTSRNEILLERELCFETDTGLGKLGDGVTPWNDLDYLAGDASSGDGQTPTFIASTDSFTVAANKQVLFSESIVVDGDLIVAGILIEV